MNYKNYKAYQESLKEQKMEETKQACYKLNNKQYLVSTGRGDEKSKLNLSPEFEDFITQLLSAMFESETIFFTCKYIDYVLSILQDVRQIKKESGQHYITEVLESRNVLEDVEMKMRVEAFPNKAYGTLYRLETFEAGGLKFKNSASGKHVIFKMEDE